MGEKKLGMVGAGDPDGDGQNALGAARSVERHQQPPIAGRIHCGRRNQEQGGLGARQHPLRRRPEALVLSLLEIVGSEHHQRDVVVARPPVELLRGWAGKKHAFDIGRRASLAAREPLELVAAAVAMLLPLHRIGRHVEAEGGLEHAGEGDRKVEAGGDRQRVAEHRAAALRIVEARQHPLPHARLERVPRGRARREEGRRVQPRGRRLYHIRGSRKNEDGNRQVRRFSRLILTFERSASALHNSP